MAVAPELEIQDWQKKPGLKNPLTKDQVERIGQLMVPPCPDMGERAIQQVAEIVALHNELTLSKVAEQMDEF